MCIILVILEREKKVIFIHMYVISLYPILVLAAIVKDWDVALFFPAVQPGSTFPLQVLSIYLEGAYRVFCKET